MEQNTRKIDWIATVVPLICIGVLSVVFTLTPAASTKFLETIRNYLGDRWGIYYALMGLGVFASTMYMAFSPYGKIVLGGKKTPEYSSFKWGTMIFTSTMAADILFYSLCEWAMYSQESSVKALGVQKWAATYPLFHWGPIAWSFYIALAVAFGFMLHVKNVHKQKFSEACRPILGRRVDGMIGKAIDLFAVFALLAGTATTFSLATPLLATAVSQILGIKQSTLLTIGILLLIAIVYTVTVLFGMEGVSKLATYCSYLFFVLMAYVLIGGGEAIYILETGLSSLGNMFQNFIGLATWMDPLRESSFPQRWTIYYWAYWMVWCVATPFFIGQISRGRTIRNVVIGGYGWGLAGTYTSFIILGNYGLAQQMKRGIAIGDIIEQTGNHSQAIMEVLSTLPLHKVALVMLVLTMIAFYSTTFDALTMVISTYSYKSLPPGMQPDKRVRTFWAIMFIVMPIGLIFGGKSMYALQSVSIIAAFPIGLIIIVILAGFFKEAKEVIDRIDRI